MQEIQRHIIAVLLGHFLSKTWMVEEKNVSSCQESEMILLNGAVDRKGSDSAN